MAVAAGEIDSDHARIAPHQIGHDRPGAIARAVVQQNEFVVGTGDLLRGGSHAPVKFFEARFLVVAGRDDAEPRAGAHV
jgi:hypothetical protein